MENYKKKISLLIPINSSVEHYMQLFDGCLDYFVNPHHSSYVVFTDDYIRDWMVLATSWNALTKQG